MQRSFRDCADKQLLKTCNGWKSMVVQGKVIMSGEQPIMYHLAARPATELAVAVGTGACSLVPMPAQPRPAPHDARGVLRGHTFHRLA